MNTQTPLSDAEPTGAAGATDARTVDFSRGIFLFGFARGGTTWGRQVFGAHPDVFEVPGQVDLPAANVGRAMLANRILSACAKGKKNPADSLRFIAKSPANAAFMDKIVAAAPEMRYVFVVRDPRDVLISYQRTGAGWTDAQSSFDDSMDRTRRYFEGYERARQNTEVFEYSYEDMHQTFPRIYRAFCRFAGLECSPDIIRKPLEGHSFQATTGRDHVEQKGHKRKGVVGDWANHLTYADAERFRSDPFWAERLERYGYDWNIFCWQRLVPNLLDRASDVTIYLSLAGANWAYRDAMRRRLQDAVAMARMKAQKLIVGLTPDIPPAGLQSIADCLDGLEWGIEIAAETKMKALTETLDGLKSCKLKPKTLVTWTNDQPRPERFAARIGSNLVKLRGGAGQAPLISEEDGCLKIVGLPLDFDARRQDSYGAAQGRGLLVAIKPLAVSVHNPLTLGFREDFGSPDYGV